jgi:uncharacterized lipoprotein YbaY
MKLRFFPGALLGVVLLAAGCGHLDVTPPGAEDRVLTGLVTYELDMPLPDDAVVTVRVIDASNPASPMVLGETTITRPGHPPIPFRVEYRADDELLTHQVKVEARISIGGKLRFYSVAGYPVTLGNVNDTHVVKVEPADR